VLLIIGGHVINYVLILALNIVLLVFLLCCLFTFAFIISALFALAYTSGIASVVL